MEFLKNNKRFSFLYGEKNVWDCDIQKSEKEIGNKLITEYIIDNELKIINTATKYSEFDAYEWVSEFECISSKPTKVIKNLLDCDINLDFEHDEPQKNTAYLADYNKVMKIFSPSGSQWERDEFFCSPPDRIHGNYHEYHIYPGQMRNFKPWEGRSSEGKAPFFNIFRQNKGVVFAIGWSGRWNCEIERECDCVDIRTKIDDTEFYLLPKEKIRTSSFVMMNYDGDFYDAQNKWRRLVKTHFSLIGSEGRDEYGPLCTMLWGGMSSKGAIERIKSVQENEIPVEYIWMDAGWYGSSVQESPDEFEGDWALYTGDWRINKTHHPDELLQVRSAIKEAGKKFLLWFEPERTTTNSPIVREHPEYFLKAPSSRDYLLNLGDENAFDYCLKTLSEIIEKLEINCYRQDFNFCPLEIWRSNDAFERKGISEIKHINGLYKLWDALLEKFPHLIIDNCASGGRRIDIETLRRSIPLWRSDASCPANYPPEFNQSHGINFGTWMPYSGTGSGRDFTDVYRLRSAYAPAFGIHIMYSEKDEVLNNKEKAETLRKYLNEYLRVRPYLSADIYPHTPSDTGDDAWCIVQYNRPEQSDGILQVFKREKSVYNSAVIRLRGIDENASYIFTDADDNSSFEITGTNLELKINENKAAKIYFHKKITN